MKSKTKKKLPGAKRTTAKKNSKSAKTATIAKIYKTRRTSRSSVKKAASKVDAQAQVGENREPIRTLSKEAILPYLAGALLFGAAFMTFIVYRSYGWAFFIAMSLYVGFSPYNNRLVRLLRGRRNLSSALMTLLVTSLILGPASLITRLLLLQAVDLLRALRSYLARDDILDWIRSVPIATDAITDEPFFWVNINSMFRTYLGSYSQDLDPDKLVTWAGNAYSWVSGGVSVTAGFAANLTLGIIILFFLFRDGPSFYSFVVRALPFPKVITGRFVRRMVQIARTVLLGNVLISVVQGALIGFALYICDISSFIVYGVIAGIFSLIPIVGTSVVWIPAALYLVFVRESYGYALFLSIYGMFFYLVMENIVKPKIMDRRLGIHPLMLFLSILGGLAEFGITGVILGPLIVTLFMTLWSIYHIWGDDDHPEIDRRKT